MLSFFRAFIVIALTSLDVEAQPALVERNPVNQPSFDCAKAKWPVEILICADADLAHWDNQLGQAYNSRRRGLDETARLRLRDEQRQWAQTRRAQCNIPSSSTNLAELARLKPCLMQMTQRRIEELGAATQPPRTASQPSSTPMAQTSAGSTDPIFERIRGTVDCNYDGVSQLQFTAAAMSKIPRLVHSRLSLDTVDKGIFVDGRLINEMLGHFDDVARQHCKQQGVATLPSVHWIVVLDTFAMSRVGNEGSLNSVFSAYTLDGRQWSIEHNVVARNASQELAQRRAQEEAQRQARAELERIAQSKQVVRSAFASQHGIQKFVDANDLMSNPFVYKDQIVAFPTQFMQMFSSSEGIFNSSFAEVPIGGFIVSNVPSTLFAGRRSVVLAVQVRGMRAIRTPSGENNVPDLRYIGSHHCSQFRCGDILN